MQKNQHRILALLECEFPEKTKEERSDLLYKVLKTMYSFDPGIGINRPRGAAKP